MANLMDILNWLGVILTIFGSIIIATKHPKPLITNCCYAVACILMIVVFIAAANYAMVTMYIILLIISIRGIWLQYPRRIKYFIFPNGERTIIKKGE
jgi:hypothetical protein